MVFDLICNIDKVCASRNGVLHAGQMFSYAALAEQALRTATVLSGLDIGRGDVVALILGRNIDYIVTLMAVSALGAITMPLNPKYEQAELAQLFLGARPRLIMTDGRCAAKCRQALEHINLDALLASVDDTPGTHSLSKLRASAALATPIKTVPDDDAFIFHSSGSTGRSKLMRRTNRQVTAEVESFAEAVRSTADDVFLDTVPLYHAHGFSNCLLASLKAQASLVLFPEFLPAALARDRLADVVETHRVTVFPAVPMIFEALAKTSRQTDLGSLRLCFSAGTSLPEATFRAFLEHFNIPVRQLYGCTEAGALSLNTGYQVEQTWRSVGRPLPGVQCEILDPDEQGIGSIRIASPGLTKGYDRLPEAAENSFANGWFITGDRGRLDKDGYLYITGRRALYIEVAGHKVDPYEIEDVLMRHPQIHEAAVVGINTAAGRSALKAVVVPTVTPSPSEEDLFRYCSEQLAMYKVPQIYEYRDALPRNPLGKVLKKYLIE